MTSQQGNLLGKTGEFWAQEEERYVGGGIHWTDLEAVQRRIATIISGNCDIGWPQYFAENHLIGKLPLERCLSLCCGKGRLERDLAKANFCRYFVGIDASEGSLEYARNKAHDEGCENIQYEFQDINRIKLPEQTYDLIIAASAMHHIQDLEHVYDELSRALKKEGRLILLDYVGANRFQVGERQRAIIDAVFELIPKQYRKIITAAPADIEHSISDPIQTIQVPENDSYFMQWARKRFLFQKLKESGIGRKIRGLAEDPLYKHRVHFSTVDEIVGVDPSEAVRSAEVVPVLREYFDIEEFKPLGGSLLHLLLYQIAGNFDSGNALGSQFLEMFFQIEDLLMKSGELDSDLVFLIAHPKK